MSDALRRGTRTLIDIAFVQAIITLLVEFGVELSAGQRAAIVTLGTFLVSALKNALEDSGAIPALLKAPASDGADPIPHDAGRSDLEAALLVGLAAFGIFCLIFFIL